MIVVTGAAGFIGSAFVRYLNDAGSYDLILVDDFKKNPHSKNISGKKYSQLIDKDDFLEQIQKNSLPQNISAIIHMGACSSTLELNKDFLYQNNFLYTKTLAEYSLAHGIRYIYASSAATYGDGARGYSDSHDTIPSLIPLNPYGDSKQMFDVWALTNGHLNNICGLKFFNVYGPNEYDKGEMRSVVIKSFEQIQSSGEVKLFKSYKPEYADGEQKRDFLYVRDCCDAMMWLLKNPSINGIYNIGSGKAESWNALATGVFHALGKPVNIKYIEMPEPLRNQYQYFTKAPMEKLKKAGYHGSFRSIAEGAKDYVQEFLLKDQRRL